MKEIKKAMYGKGNVWKRQCMEKAMYEKGNVWKILYVSYAMAFVLNLVTGIKNKNIADIENCFWIINTIIMFACARMNEKRADKFQELYFDEIEKEDDKNV